jgi:hypothetical protein
MMEIEEAEARHVPRAHVEEVGRILRYRRVFVVPAVGRRIILHSDGASDLRGERVEYRGKRGRFVDSACCVEVPIVVIPIRPGGVASSRGALLFFARRLVVGDMVDARAGFEQLLDGRALLVVGQRRGSVVDAELPQ